MLAVEVGGGTARDAPAELAVRKSLFVCQLDLPLLVAGLLGLALPCRLLTVCTAFHLLPSFGGAWNRKERNGFDFILHLETKLLGRCLFSFLIGLH